MLSSCVKDIAGPVDITSPVEQAPTIAISQEGEEVYTRILLRAKLLNSKDTVRFVWKSGDSVIAQDTNLVQVFYAAPGSYPVLCQARTSANDSLIAQDTFDVVVTSKTDQAPSLEIQGTSGEIFTPIDFKAVLSNFAAPVVYRWTSPSSMTNNDTECVSISFIEPGTYIISCVAIDSLTSLLVASKSISVIATAPSVKLDWQALQALNNISIRVNAQMTYYQQSGSWSAESKKSFYGPTFPIKIERWTDSGSYNYYKFDTMYYFHEEKHLFECKTLIDRGSSMLKNLNYTVQNTLREGGLNPVSKEDEVSIHSGKLYLIKQTLDSAVFAVYGKRCFSLNAYSIDGSGSLGSSSGIKNIQWDFEPEKQSCFVVFFRR
jgi:hypothetical protein